MVASPSSLDAFICNYWTAYDKYVNIITPLNI